MLSHTVFVEGEASWTSRMVSEWLLFVFFLAIVVLKNNFRVDVTNKKWCKALVAIGGVGILYEECTSLRNPL